MKYLVVVNGYSGSGKDEFCIECRKALIQKSVSAYIEHSSDRAKTFLYEMGWDGERTPEVRQLLTDLVAFGESTGAQLKRLYSLDRYISSNSIVFYHERNPVEIQKIVDHYKEQEYIKVITVFVNRGILNKNEKDRWGLEEFSYDVMVNNFGTLEDLKNAAVAFCEQFLEV